MYKKQLQIEKKKKKTKKVCPSSSIIYYLLKESPTLYHVGSTHTMVFAHPIWKKRLETTCIQGCKVLRIQKHIQHHEALGIHGRIQLCEQLGALECPHFKRKHQPPMMDKILWRPRVQFAPCFFVVFATTTSKLW